MPAIHGAELIRHLAEYSVSVTRNVTLVHSPSNMILTKMGMVSSKSRGNILELETFSC